MSDTRRSSTKQGQSRTLRAPRQKLSRTSSSRPTSRQSQQFLTGLSPRRPDSPIPASVSNVNAQGTIRASTGTGSSKGRQSLEVLKQHIGQQTSNSTSYSDSRQDVLDDAIHPIPVRSSTAASFAARMAEVKFYEGELETTHVTREVLLDTQAKQPSPATAKDKEVFQAPSSKSPKGSKENRPLSLDDRVVEILTNQHITVVWSRDTPRVQTVKIRPFVKYSVHWDVEE